MSLAFVYMATRVPSMLGNAGTFDSWLSMLYFGMNLPASMVRSAKTIGLIAGEEPQEGREAWRWGRWPPARAFRRRRAASTRRLRWRLHRAAETAAGETPPGAATSKRPQRRPTA